MTTTSSLPEVTVIVRRNGRVVMRRMYLAASIAEEMIPTSEADGYRVLMRLIVEGEPYYQAAADPRADT